MKIKVVLVIVVVALFLMGNSSCNWGEATISDIGSALKGRPTVINTYDESAQVIDEIKGSAVDIRADGKFDLKNADGTTVEKSSVINIIVGSKTMLHVGSSMIAHEEGLPNVFDEFAKTVDTENFDRSTPIINRLVADFKNLTTGHKFLILVRSQTGKPLATFIGDSVSYFSTNIDKSTAFWVDDMFLFIYRCDYTVYDLSLLE